MERKAMLWFGEISNIRLKTFGQLCASLLLVAVTVGCDASTTNKRGGGMSAERSRVLSPDLTRELTRLAREQASENKLDIRNCASKIVQEGDRWVVEFHPSDLTQFGGGGRFWFKVEKEKIVFEKMGRWE